MSETTLEQMEIAITDLQPCQKKAEITIPPKDIETQTSSLVKEFASQATLPGFRVGKAPAALVRKRFADSIDAEVLKKIQLAVFDKLQATVDTDLTTLPLPEAKLELPKNNETMKFTLSFDVAPKIDLPAYKGIKIKQEAIEIDKKDIENEIDRFRNEYAEMKKVEASVEEEDMLEIALSSDIDCPENAPDSMKRLVNAEKTWCWLTSEYELLPGMLKALKGKKKGETVELVIEFPEDFTEPLLAGKKAHYKITVNEVERRVPITDDKALCEKLGVDDMETLAKRISDNFKQTRENESKSKNMDDAFESLMEKLGNLPLPPSILAQETQQALSRMANEILKTQEDAEKFKDDIDKHKKDAEKQATERLNKFFIAKEIVKKENIEVGQKDLDAGISGLSRAYGQDEKKLRQIMERNGGLEQLHMDLTIRKAMEFIFDNADIVEAKSSKKTKAEKKPATTKKTENGDKTEKE
ncbi:MAG: trigger factor [Kiritimatiellaeota bacterium]|nr:trigger factor [Kiritimatiellota bacterium]